MNTGASAAADPAEIRKFDALAHAFWDPQGPFRPLHVLNPVRLGYVSAHAPLAGVRALDVGCGGGLLAEALAGAGAQVMAIDLAAQMIEIARLHAHESGAQVDYRLCSVEDCAREHAGAFEVVTCMELIEHVPSPAALLVAMAHALRPGGSLFVSTINRNLRSFLSAIVGAEYLLRLLPRGTHEYARLIKPSELATHARRAGLTLTDLSGLEYNPLTRSARLTRDPGVNYLAHFRRDTDAQ